MTPLILVAEDDKLKRFFLWVNPFVGLLSKWKDVNFQVCMVTDDDGLTATAIAKKCGIFEDASDRNIMTGAEFRNLDILERTERAKDLLV